MELLAMIAVLVAFYWIGKCRRRKRVKRALKRQVGGRRVRVAVEGFDRYGRVLGTVSCRGRDVGEWLVRSGHALACFDNRYKDAESEAKSERRGMWGYKEVYDPRAWRRR